MSGYYQHRTRLVFGFFALLALTSPAGLSLAIDTGVTIPAYLAALCLGSCLVIARLTRQRAPSDDTTGNPNTPGHTLDTSQRAGRADAASDKPPASDDGPLAADPASALTGMRPPPSRTERKGEEGS